MRRIFPVITLFLAFLMDTSVLPVLYRGPLTTTVTLAVVFCISLRLGKLRGAMYGMFAGMAIDITAGSLPYMTLIMLAMGAVTSLLVPEYLNRSPRGRQVHLTRAALAFVLYMLLEIGLDFYAYYRTAMLASGLWLYALLRGLIFALLCVLLAVPLTALYPKLSILQPREDEPETKGGVRH